MKDEFGNYIGPDPPPPPAWKVYGKAFGRWLFDKAEDAWSFAEIIAPPLIVIAILALAMAVAVSAVIKPKETITLDRSEWVCTQASRETVVVTQQGIPLNKTVCMQWSRQP